MGVRLQAASRRAEAPRPAAAAFFALGVGAPTAASVSTRIRTAIDLGLLSDGEPLPKEADLARQLDVTVFTLREALSQLRSEGLVVTRVGRGGGSFVHRAPERTAAAARAQLAAMSSIALRDLGDWRSMLAGESAELASSRASAGNIARLLALAEQVRSGDKTVARRAFARFRVELAASAQSLRMSVADLTLHEEFGDLFALPIEDAEFRRESAALLDAIIDAVRRHDGPAARSAALVESRHAVDALLRRRLRLLTPRDAAGGTPADRLDALAEQAWVVPRRVLSTVRKLADRARADVPALLDDQGADDDLAPLHTAAAAALNAAGRRVQGMGVMFAPGAIPRHPFGGAWFARRDGAVVSSPHAADPHRDDFYDYSMAEWMTGPQENSEPAIVGPYVDYGGADEYILTISAPVISAGVFVGVAAADVLLADYEAAVAPALSRVDRACCVVNAESRVVVSNTAAFPPGSVLPAKRSGDRRPCGDAGWSIVAVE